MKGLLYIRSVSLVALFLCGYISSYDLSLVSHSPSATCVLQYITITHITTTRFIHVGHSLVTRVYWGAGGVKEN
ncbi:MAG: Ni,Fe-hydrogenase I cytochrome b subunit [Bacillariaceae sp.]|jgi:Ni,Fe-hydrogenase I cytochrome b subunit